MNDEILVSVIMPVHNAKNWLDKSVASLLNQTIRNYEVILINDGSDDGSEFVLEKWAAADRAIKLINRGNEGVSFSRNEGIRKARGKYLFFADADDYVESDMFRCMSQVLEDTGAVCAICDYYEEDEAGNRKEVHLPWDDMQILSDKEVRGELIPYMIKVLDSDRAKNNCLVNNIVGTVWRLCVRKDFLIDNNIYFDENIKIAEDFDFCVRLFIKSGSVACIKHCLYHYVRYNSTTLAVYRENAYETGIQNQMRLKNFLIENGMYEEILDRFHGSYIDECLAVPYNFVRPNAPGYFKKIKKLRGILKSMSKDELLQEAAHDLSFNQRIAMFLINHKMSALLLLLTHIRNKK